jgi:hypothetical protein
MKALFATVSVVALLILSPQQLKASPLTMDYTVAPTAGGLYDYNFTLILDNNDGREFKPEAQHRRVKLASQGPFGRLLLPDKNHQPESLRCRRVPRTPILPATSV